LSYYKENVNVKGNLKRTKDYDVWNRFANLAEQYFPQLARDILGRRKGNH